MKHIYFDALCIAGQNTLQIIETSYRSPVLISLFLSLLLVLVTLFTFLFYFFLRHFQLASIDPFRKWLPIYIHFCMHLN